jgi:uncharacterized protein involved in exopolysaccharide biosynthesis
MTAAPPIKPALGLAQLSPLSLLRMLWLHRLSILVIWLLASVITAAIVRRIPAQYQAEISILVEPQKIPGSVVQSMVTTPLQDRLLTISAQILSTTQLQKVIDDFGLYKKERKDLVPEEITQMMRKNITTQIDRAWTNNTPGAFRVRYRGDEPAVVAQVANRLGNMFIEQNLQSRETTVEGTNEFLETQLQDAKKRLDDAEAQIATYRQKHNGELPEQLNAINAALSRLEGQQAADKAQIARDEDQKEALEETIPLAEDTLNGLLEQDAQAQLAAQTNDQAGAPSARRSTQVKAAPPAPLPPPPPRQLKESEKLEIELAADQAKYGPAHPEIKRLKSQIARAKAAEEKLGETVAQTAPPPAADPLNDEPDKQEEEARAPPAPPAAVPNVARTRRERPEITQARERIRGFKAQAEKLEKEMAALQEDQKRLSQSIVETSGKLNDVPVREREIAQIMRDHAELQQEYQGLVTKLNAAKISTDMELRQESERFAINDPAQAPGRPISPDRVMLTLLGSVGGLILGLAVAFGQEFKKNRVLGGWELPEEVRVLAEVPWIGPIGRPAGGFWTGWSWPRRFAVLSGVLIPIVALAVAARIYLK